MLHVQCNNCGTSAYVECARGCELVMGAHLDGCPGAPENIGRQVRCPPGSGCCQEDHSHFASCAGDHDGDHGPENPDCPVCKPLTITAPPGSAGVVLTPLGG
jgi:hypothetical protein